MPTPASSHVVRRLDYTPPLYSVDQTELTFELGAKETLVTARLSIQLTSPSVSEVTLDGKNLALRSIAIDGKPLLGEHYRQDEDGLTLFSPPLKFVLETVVALCPATNTALEGLYLSNRMLCTQCEANGFRRITFFPDRPDVLSRYRVRLIAPQDQFAQLLSNGNLIKEGVLDDGRRFADWEDPFPKPSYLFAVVAGDLCCHEDTYTTASGRRVTLRIFHEPDGSGQTDHAMASVKKSIQWDEEVFGLEYDLDLFMIVAVHDFNMGAMENKGLNVFNAKYILASPETATDLDYANIEGIIAHEYFHNWTGNRVTCRDWFQLSLKEGLTVFRDQEFSADMGHRGVSRIRDVRILRSNQFKEDSGPNAHPVRPEQYIEMNNLYTATVYDKGAEIVRMYHTLLGHAGFMAGMRRYIDQFDGKAATCDDFRLAMAEANKVELSQFERWYDQAGTPQVTVSDHYDQLTQSYTITLQQSCPPTVGQPNKRPFHIPFALGLVLPNGQNLMLERSAETGAEQTTRVIELRDEMTELTFPYVPERPIPSLLRDFSAPVQCHYDYTDEALGILIRFDDNDFARFEAVRLLMLRDLTARVNAKTTASIASTTSTANDAPPSMGDILLQGLSQLLQSSDGNDAWTALALEVPSEMELLEQFLPAPVEHITQAREELRLALAKALEPLFFNTFKASQTTLSYTTDPASVGKRALKNLCLSYLVLLKDEAYLNLCVHQFEQANNMTDAQAALTQLMSVDHPARPKALNQFYDRWYANPLVVDKWFTLQAQARRPEVLQEVEALLEHPAFTWTNPNRVRSLIGSFAMGNPSGFHQSSGAGYRFLSTALTQLDPINPQTAARLVTALIDWKKYDPTRQAHMRTELERLKAVNGLSANTLEMVNKGLAD